MEIGGHRLVRHAHHSTRSWCGGYGPVNCQTQQPTSADQHCLCKMNQGENSDMLGGRGT